MPTSKRCSSKGAFGLSSLRFHGFKGLEPVIGPIASTVDDCVLGMKVQFDKNIHLLDPERTPTEWNEEMYNSV